MSTATLEVIAPTTGPPGVLPHHLAELRASGLSDETICAAQIRSETKHAAIAAMLNRKRWTAAWGAALTFPFLDAAGDIVLRRVKPDNPPMRGGKPAKYLSPTGAVTRLYVPPGVHAVLDDVTPELIITEGEKKSLCASQHGFPCVGLVGVDCWHERKSSSLIPDLAAITWNNRRVFIAFDSDAMDNANVRRAEVMLADTLTRRGAIVRVVRLPSTPDGAKVGLDDFLVANDPVALRKLLDAAEEPEPIDPGELREPASEMYFDAEAERMLSAMRVDGASTLRFWRGSFWRWRCGAYREIADAEMRARVTTALNTGYFRVGASHVGNTLEHLRAQTLLSDRTDAPAWIAPRKNDWPTSGLLVAKNAIVNLPALFVSPETAIIAPTPALFSTSALDFDFIAGDKCAKPERWLRFLGELWPDDPEAIEALQMWFGYLLTADTRQQKMLALIGPKRSGKGTIIRVLQALIGRENCAAPTLSSFATNFGLQPLIGKTLAVIADARFSGRADAAVICERILSITGEDAQTIDRKHREPITVALPTRLMLVSNELPRLNDSSGALAGRLIVLQLTQSWFGREDHGLTDALLAELPGILWWAIDGWAKLRQCGRLVQPASGDELLREAEDLLSPVSVFVREECVVGPDHEVSRQELYGAYAEWARSKGRAHVEDEAGFGRNLRAAVPGVRTAQHRIGGDPVRHYRGIALLGGV